MATSGDVLRIARNELGNTSGKKYWDYYFDGDEPYVNGGLTPYCACFVSWVMNQAGVKAAGIPAAYCPYICRDAKNGGALIDKHSAQPGDIVLFDWDSDGLSDHVGLVESNEGSYLQTIEGNTSGGIVTRRTRNFSDICHIVRPYYDGGCAPEIMDEKLDVDGWAGPKTILKLQYALGITYASYLDGVLSGQRQEFAEYFPNVCSCTWETDGSYAIKLLQRRYDCVETGVWDRAFSTLMQTVLTEMGYDCGSIDGYFGYKSCCALQQALNDGVTFS